MVLNFVENHDYWQKFFDPILGSQKQKNFIQLWTVVLKQSCTPWETP